MPIERNGELYYTIEESLELSKEKTNKDAIEFAQEVIRRQKINKENNKIIHV